MAGIIASAGKSSTPQRMGVAPGATLDVVGIMSETGALVSTLNLADTLQAATRHGARIVNLSFGKTDSNGVYDDWSHSLDTFIYNNPDVLIVVAAGNDGTATSGYPDHQTVNSPGTANNVITVGACGSVRPDITTSWGTYNSNRFPYPPISLAAMAGSPSTPAALSSRGPTKNSTLKPDLLAPGTFVLSTKASGGTLQSAEPVPDGAANYIFLHGSSMAAPFISGAAAILRQYLRTEMKVPAPSAALLKAILCACAVRGPQMIDPNKPDFYIGYPDFDQGFGTVNLGAILPHIVGDRRRLAFADVPNKSTDALASRQQPDNSPTRSSRSYRFSVAKDAGPLRVVLTWTDAPGPGVKNDILLDVKGPGTALVGNHEFNYPRALHFNAKKLAGVQYDTSSNVQIVSIASPAAGDYYANILADNTFQINGKQGYAVCICGDLTEDMLPVKI